MARAQQMWRDVAAAQAGLITRRQLAEHGVDRWAVAHRVQTERWQLVSPTVVCTTTGELSRLQRMWAGVLNAGPEALLGGLSAAEVAGLKNWHRDDITVLTPYANAPRRPGFGVVHIRTRRELRPLRMRDGGLPRMRLEPALLLFAAADRSTRTAQGVLAAAVQQRLTTPAALTSWLERLRPLPKAPLLRRALIEMDGGAQSWAELDVKQLCRRHRLALPNRQTKRRDADGRTRYTDCEWLLPGGRILILEIDGIFHMDVEQWGDDLARQRALSDPSRIIIRCTARDLREDTRPARP